MVRRFALAAVLVAASIVSLSACGKPKAGGKCTSADPMSCTDGKSGLFCGKDGTYATMNCGGAQGCVANGTKVTCDQSIAATGDGCTASGFACATDMKNALSCTDGKFVLAETCKGPGACKVATGDIYCDNDIADIGDPCRDDGDYACTQDKLAALKCTGKKMVTVNSCRGPRSCAIVHPNGKPKETDIDCDMSVAVEKDPCAFPGNEACTSDKKTMLTCKGNIYTSATPCPGPKGCSVTANAKSFKVTCDTDSGGGGDKPGGGSGGGGGGKKGKKR